MPASCSTRRDGLDSTSSFCIAKLKWTSAQKQSRRCVMVKENCQSSWRSVRHGGFVAAHKEAERGAWTRLPGHESSSAAKEPDSVCSQSGGFGGPCNLDGRIGGLRRKKDLVGCVFKVG